MEDLQRISSLLSPSLHSIHVICSCGLLNIFSEVVLKDIVVIEESNADTVNGLINFQKRQLLFRAITSIQNYQQRPYNLQPVHQIESLLALSERKGEAELMEMSYKCEKK